MAMFTGPCLSDSWLIFAFDTQRQTLGKNGGSADDKWQAKMTLV